MLKKILIADRSENALNVIRCCREMGIQTVALFSDIDFNALHIVLADFCCHLKGTTLSETYCNADEIIKAAKSQGCDAIFPGYNFFNLDGNFATKVIESGLVLVGANADNIFKIDNYFQLIESISKVGLNTIECEKILLSSPAEIYAALDRINYPAFIRFGSNFRDIEVVKQSDDVDRILNKISKLEQTPEFIVIQKYLPQVMLVGVKLIADKMGTCIALHDFNASVQINSIPQTIQGPCVELPDSIRDLMVKRSKEIVAHLKLSGVITVEFVVDQNELYFWDLELSQTENSTLTELITGINIVEQMIRFASGETLKLQQSDVSNDTYALVVNIKAEDSLVGFMQSINRINRYLPATGYGLCLESAVYEGHNLPIQFGTSLGRLFSWGKNRKQAISRLKRGLQEFIITGPRTNIPFFLFLLDHPKFTENHLHTNIVEDEFSRLKLRLYYHTDDRSIELERAAITSALSYYLKSEETVFKTEDHANASNWSKYHRFWETAYKD